MRENNKTRVLLVAQPFAFGPVGSLMTIRRQICRNDLEWSYLGPEYTEQVVDSALFENVTYLNSGELETGNIFENAITYADVIVSGTEFRHMEMVVKKGRKLVIYDPLFWFWQTVPPFVSPNMTYVCQNFPGVESRVASLDDKIRDLFHITPPMIQLSDASRSSEPHLVINLCGFVNPIGTLVGYDEIIARSLTEALKDSRWQKVTVTGCLDAMPGLSMLLPSSVFELRRLSHLEMMDCIRSAWLFLTCPGLNSTMEAMSMGIPTAFLPPQNSSQAFQFEVFQREGVSDGNVNWCAMAGEGAMWKRGDQAQSINALGAAMKQFKNETWQRHELVKTLRRALAVDDSELENLARRQGSFYASLAPSHLQTFPEIFDSVIADLDKDSAPVLRHGPEVLQVEITTKCNLNCIFCHNDDPRVQARGSLSYETFTDLVDQVGPSCRRVNLWGTGEPFFHPDIFRMANYARNAGIPRVKVSTNGHLFTANCVDNILESGITEIRVSLESACPVRYQEERIGGSLPVVIEGIRLLLDRRNERGSELRVVLASVVSNAEMGAADDVSKLAESLGTDEHEIMPNIWSEQLPGLMLDPPNIRCSQPLTVFSVLANGDVIPCCGTYLETVVSGNIHDERVHEIWCGKKANRVRAKFQGGEFQPCSQCNYGARLPQPRRRKSAS